METFPWTNILTSVAVPVAVGALLWWRTGILEKEVLNLRNRSHDLAGAMQKVEGKTDVLLSMLSRFIDARLP